MKRKFVTVDKILSEIKNCEYFIEDLEQELTNKYKSIEREKKRLKYLKLLGEFLTTDSISPYAEFDIYNDEKLQHYCLPLLVKKSFKNSQEESLKTYEVSPSNIGQILSDFVDFVNNMKGHRVGVGDLHIQKFLDENTFVRCK